MSIPLFKSELKAGSKLLLLFMAIITLYGTTIVAMYDPEVGAGMNELAESMPQLFAAFGMEHPGTTLLDFLINYLYGFLLLIIPFIYIILSCYRLLAKYIEKGSMAYLLNTGCSRKCIILTQTAALLTGLLMLILYSMLLLMLCSHFLFEGELDILGFLSVNFGLFCIELFLASLCFLSACLFHEIKYSIGIGAGLGLVFFLIQMLSQVSKEIEWLIYATPLSLFDAQKLAALDNAAFLKSAVLWLAAILFFFLAGKSFQRKDLPL